MTTGRSLSKKSVAASEEDSEIVQEHPEDAPAGWVEVQDNLAVATGLSVLLVDGLQPPALVASNNNSICHAFQSSPDRVALCDPYCGDAHRRAMSAGALVHYKCHAGLECFTMPVEIGGRQNLAAIGGRAFISGADYRSLADRFRAGELNDLLPKEPFQNVIFAEADRLDHLSTRLNKAARSFAAPSKAAPDSLSEAIAKIEETITAGLEAQPADITTQVRTDLEEENKKLRTELEFQSRLSDSMQGFLERISSDDPAKTYRAILTHVAELLPARRASLWIVDETLNELILRATIGSPVDEKEVSRIKSGEGIAGGALTSGRPLVVQDISKTTYATAHEGRNYQTKSFISYPLILNQRKIGVLNVTDKSDGGTFDDIDLSLLDIVGPQIAMALERAEWQERATQYQLMSITDKLTGLLNRRYLEERLTEEINRSKRYNHAVSCLMIDIDDFKNYNDRNGHQAGDEALQITALNLKSALRSADIACRYGGEEFCILLPQTSVTEAGVIAERMRRKVAEADYPFGKSQPMGKVSISVGISTLGRNIDSLESVIAAADSALYAAKSQGKNRIEFYVDNLTRSTTDAK